MMKKQPKKKKQLPRHQPQKNKMRLQRFIALSTHYSRRSAEDLINKGVVSVNGKIIQKPGTTIDPQKDSISLNGEKLKIPAKFIYVILHKPTGYISTRSDTHNRKTVMNLIPYSHVHPVGRLDKDTEGLLILTNDGDLTYKISHPKFEHEKEYVVHLKNPISSQQIKKIEKGIIVDGKKTTPCTISQVKEKTKCHITIHEGKKRQIRRMFEETGNIVIYLKRIRIGKLRLGNLKKGSYKLIKKHEIEKFLS